MEETQDIYAHYSIPDAQFDLSHKINQRTYNVHKTDTTYQILTYDKAFLCVDEPIKHTQCRSVIMANTDKTSKLLSFSPPRSISLNTFIHCYPATMSNIHISEIIEGTLIHLFYDDRIASWEIATKNAVGGHYTLFRNLPELNTIIHDNSSLTVREMVLDALCTAPHTPLNEIPLLSNLDQYYSYSFVLQHPQNPIVLPIERPSLYLVAVYDIFQEERRVVSIPPPIFKEWSCFINSVILFPKDYTPEFVPDFTYSDIVNRFASSSQNTYHNMGIMLTNLENGDRCSIRNPVYDEVLQCKDMDTELQYKWICLFRIDRLGEYLTYFPKHKSVFIKFQEQYNTFVENLHAAYMSKYILRTREAISPKYAKYVEQIHINVRIPSLAKSHPAKVSITRKIVREFMKKIEPAEMLYCLNYERRQYATH